MPAETLTATVVHLQGPRQLVWKDERLDLTALAPTELAAETLYSAISPGTERAAWVGDPPLRPGNIYPRLMGYCNVARVIAVGAAVEGLSVGDHILTGQSHRSAFICDAAAVHAKLPPTERLAAASTTYLFHLGYAAMMRGDLRPGHNVAIIGLGCLGLTTAAIARAAGATVVGFSNQADLGELAGRFGIERVFDKALSEARRQELAALTRGAGIDLVATTSNRWDDWELALRLPRYLGTICVLGFPGREQPQPPFNPLQSRYFYDQQLSIHACGYMPRADAPAHDLRFTTKRNCAWLLSQIIAERLPADALISSILPSSAIADAYEALAERRPNYLTSVLQWQ